MACKILSYFTERKGFFMKNVYRQILKTEVRKAMAASKENLGYTQAKMAETLSIDPRSYAYLASGKTMCGSLTLALFLLYCCPDYVAFLEQLRRDFRQAKDRQ